MKNQKGITLIALVITIIVLLILAGVSISMVIGNNGILNQASTAGVETRGASEKEQVEMAFLAAKTLKLTDTDTSSSVVDKADLETALKNMGLVVEGNNPDVTVTGEPSNFTVTFKSGNVYKLADDIVTWDREESGVPSTPETPSTSKVYLDPEQWDYTVENGEATITKYKVSGATTVTIPNYIKGSGNEADIPITKVSGTNDALTVGAENSLLYTTGNSIWPDVEYENAVEIGVYLKSQRTITSIEISEGIEEITAGAFMGTKKLESIKLPSTLKVIGKYAFYHCSMLTSLELPSALTSIGDGAFESTGLSTVNYLGSQAEWSNISIGSNNFTDAEIKYNQ